MQLSSYCLSLSGVTAVNERSQILDNFFSAVFINQWMIIIIVSALFLFCSETGCFVGLRIYRNKDEPRKAIIGGVQGAVLGLLGLLLGFTFSMAVNRYDLRRDLVLQEANAIGTTYLRASFLPENQIVRVQELLSSYADTRLNLYDAGTDKSQRAEVEKKSNDLQALLWDEAVTATGKSQTAVVVSFITSLNEMIDLDATRIQAGRSKVPVAVWLLVLVVGCAGCYASGYNSGANGTRSAFANLLLPVLVTIVIVIIADLDRPYRGLVGVTQQPLLDLKENIKSHHP